MILFFCVFREFGSFKFILLIEREKRVIYPKDRPFNKFFFLVARNFLLLKYMITLNKQNAKSAGHFYLCLLCELFFTLKRNFFN